MYIYVDLDLISGKDTFEDALLDLITALQQVWQSCPFDDDQSGFSQPLTDDESEECSGADFDSGYWEDKEEIIYFSRRQMASNVYEPGPACILKPAASVGERDESRPNL